METAGYAKENTRETKDIHICNTCRQSTQFLLTIDKGTVDTLKGIARAIRDKGANVIHIHKEAVAGGHITKMQAGNITRLKSHGLVAKAKRHGRGNYALTSKGGGFLRGEAIMKTVIIEKATEDRASHTTGYLGEDTVVIYEFGKDWDEYWNAEGYSIESGAVVPANQIIKKEEDAMQPLFK